MESNALLLSSTDLVSDGAYLSLVFVIGAVLFIGEESEVLYLLPEGVSSNNVLVMSIVIVIILHQLLVL